MPHAPRPDRVPSSAPVTAKTPPRKRNPLVPVLVTLLLLALVIWLFGLWP